MSIGAKDIAWFQRQAELAAVSGDTRSKEVIDFLLAKFETEPTIPTGIDRETLINANKSRILELLKATCQDWEDWRWQLRNRIEDAATLSSVLNLDPADTMTIADVPNGNRWSITPYYLSLMSPDPNCPIRLQGLLASPRENGVSRENKELTIYDQTLAPHRKVRYLRVDSQCSHDCRYCHSCERRRPSADSGLSPSSRLSAALAILPQSDSGQELVLRGCDLLLLDDDQLRWFIDKLSALSYSIIHFETRVISVLPQRITSGLIDLLTSYKTINLTGLINNPLELTKEAVFAIKRLQSAGIVVEYSVVKLQGVNDNPYVMKRLKQAFSELGIHPRFSHEATPRR